MSNKKNIIRTDKHFNPFVQIDKRIFEDDRISWKAKGLLGYFLRKPDNWKIYLSDVVKRAPDGIRAVRSGLKELEKHGYLKRKPVYEDGKIAYWEHIVSEKAQLNLDAQNVQVDNVDAHNVEVQNVQEQKSTLLISNRSKIQDTDNDQSEKNTSSDIRRVWDHYNSTFGDMFPRGLTLTKERKAKILARIKAGYSVDDINLAIENIRKSGFHCGDNPSNKVYATIEFICRNDAKLEEWINYSLKRGLTMGTEAVDKLAEVPQGSYWEMIKEMQKQGLVRAKAPVSFLRSTTGADDWLDCFAPKRFKEATFDNYVLTPKNKLMFDSAKKFVDSFGQDTSSGLVLQGTTGVGKTHLAFSIGKALADMGLWPYFCNFVKIVLNIKRSWGSDTIFEGEIKSPLLSSSILILDDLGAEMRDKREQGWISELVYEIVKARYENELPTVITTNLNMDDMAERYTDRTASRLAEMCEIVWCSADDYRLQPP